MSMSASCAKSKSESIQVAELFKSEAFADIRVIKNTKITASWWFCAPALAGRMYLLPPQYPSINNNDFSTNMGKSTFLAFS